MSPTKKKKKQPPSANTEILREQIQLVKAEKELKLALEKVNEQVNKLLVSTPTKMEWFEVLKNWLILFSNFEFVGRRIAAEISTDANE